MITMKQVRRKVTSLGGTIEGGPVGRVESYCIDSPRWKVWTSDGIHCLVVSWHIGDKDGEARACKDALERIGMGLEECKDRACDTCLDEAEGKA